MSILSFLFFLEFGAWVGGSFIRNLQIQGNILFRQMVNQSINQSINFCISIDPVYFPRLAKVVVFATQLLTYYIAVLRTSS
jgi:hypothetical protein